MAKRMAYAPPFMQQHAIHDQDFLEHTVTDDDIWVYHSTPESKRASMEWNQERSPRTRKFKIVLSEAAIFWDPYGVLLVHFLERGATVNAAVHCATQGRFTSCRY